MNFTKIIGPSHSRVSWGHWEQLHGQACLTGDSSSYRQVLLHAPVPGLAGNMQEDWLGRGMPPTHTPQQLSSAECSSLSTHSLDLQLEQDKSKSTTPPVPRSQWWQWAGVPFLSPKVLVERWRERLRDEEKWC